MELTSLNASTMNYKNQPTKNFKTNYSTNNYVGSSSYTRHNNSFNHPSRNNHHVGSSSYSRNSRNGLFCDSCKRPGHIRDKCYKLHGYPNNTHTYNSQGNYQSYPRNSGQNPRIDKGKRTAANVHGVSNDMMSNYGGDNLAGDTQNGIHPSASITKEQYGQIMNMLQHFKAENAGEDQTSSAVNIGSMSCAVSIPLQLVMNLVLMVVIVSTRISGKPFPYVSSPFVNVSTCHNDNNIAEFAESSYVFNGNDVDLLWHNRLAHVPFVKMKVFNDYFISTDLVPHNASAHDPRNIVVTEPNLALNSPQPAPLSSLSTPSPLTTPAPPLVPQKTSHIPHKAPTHLKDYICSIPTLKPTVSTLSLTALFSKHHHISPDALTPAS
ncbi:uncharacterized protein LOC132613149 [Lycium barbarum]|uniref:uncharacterized protein LOC132613149 n=1 Tax=Lycium barbarum TaxID=112863 RepID=UPI00293E2A08|nr:uncharacterized protein LOC132613149 [Lycium barbarum]